MLSITFEACFEIGLPALVTMVLVLYVLFFLCVLLPLYSIKDSKEEEQDSVQGLGEQARIRVEMEILKEI